MVFRFLQAGAKKVRSALSKTRDALSSPLRALIGQGIDSHTVEDLEELLYEADLGVATASELAEKIREAAVKLDSDALLELIRADLLERLGNRDRALITAEAGPTVILMVGVNGSGKTTTTAKLARLCQQQDSNVLLGACDTFRAAAVDQLAMWADRVGVGIVKGHARQDPSAVAFDALSAAVARKADLLFLDTAGRLQSKTDLMQELDKMRRACSKVIPGAPHETLLVLDASMGQNAIDQAKTFHKYTPLTGLVLTKLDGTAKGGIVVAISQELGIPVKFIGTGEGLEDIEPFDPEAFVAGLI